ncbi:MAG: hypothetical protein K2X49_18935 [Acetobacteraceae bacterium]|nr:hypothetical protein [Acetobacteraceae bacterium]
MSRRHLVAGLLGVVLLPCARTIAANAAEDPVRHRRIGDIVIHVAVEPVLPTEPRHFHRLIVTLRSAGSGTAIADAVVRATVRGVGHPEPQTRVLDAQGGPTFEGVVELPPRDTYRIVVEVARSGAPAVAASFIHRQLQP